MALGCDGGVLRIQHLDTLRQDLCEMGTVGRGGRHHWGCICGFAANALDICNLTDVAGVCDRELGSVQPGDHGGPGLSDVEEH